MALATRCPACSTVFRISTAQAAAKGGMVRCGQCRNVFNSLDALVRVEDLEIIDEVVVAPTAAAPLDEPVDLARTESIDVAVDEPEVDPAESIEAVEPGADAREPEAARPVIGEWWLPDPADKPPPSLRSDTTDALASSSEPSIAPSLGPRDDAGQFVSGRRTDLQWSPGDDVVGPDPSFMRGDEAPPPTHRAIRWLLGIAVVLALIGIAAQAAYLWRDELAARWSPARPLLTAACGVLRCRVDYPTHLEAVTIESASIQTTGANLNVYNLTALLRNRDTIDVRYPHLELVLTDLQDRPILRRALRPEDYLPTGRPQGGFPAQSELAIRLMFELSDLKFAGFRVERFYP